MRNRFRRARTAPDFSGVQVSLLSLETVVGDLIGRLGLEVAESGAGAVLLRGQRDGRALAIALRPSRTFDASDRGRTKITLDLGGEVSEALSIRPRTGDAGGMRTGDRFFDGAFVAEGDPDLLLRALRQEVRQLFLLQRDIRIARGLLSLEIGALIPAELIESSLNRLLLIPAAFSSPGKAQLVRERLLENLRSDPAPGFRLSCARLLLERYPGADTTGRVLGTLTELVGTDRDEQVRRAALELAIDLPADAAKRREAILQGLKDPVPETRLLAARNLGEEGIEALRSLVLTPFVPAQFRLAAMEDLARLLPPPALVEVLAVAALTDEKELRVVALRKIVELEPDSWLARLRDLATRSGAYAAIDIASTAVRTDSTRAEALLLELLDHQSPAVKRHVLGALAKTGTPEALEPLRALVSRRQAGPVREAARDAIAAIQSRIPGAEPGQLSMVDPEQRAGELAIVDGQGQLELSQDEP